MSYVLKVMKFVAISMNADGQPIDAVAEKGLLAASCRIGLPPFSSGRMWTETSFARTCLQGARASSFGVRRGGGADIDRVVVIDGQGRGRVRWFRSCTEAERSQPPIG